MLATQLVRMRFRFTSIILILASVVGVLLGLILIRQRGEIPVASGYKLFRPDAECVVLGDRSGSVVVDQQIVLIGTENNLIIGRTEDPGGWAYPGWSFPVGFFTVDTVTGHVTAGLSQEQFNALTTENRRMKMRSPTLCAFTNW